MYSTGFDLLIKNQWASYFKILFGFWFPLLDKLALVWTFWKEVNIICTFPNHNILSSTDFSICYQSSLAQNLYQYFLVFLLLVCLQHYLWECNLTTWVDCATMYIGDYQCIEDWVMLHFTVSKRKCVNHNWNGF